MISHAPKLLTIDRANPAAEPLVLHLQHLCLAVLGLGQVEVDQLQLKLTHSFPLLYIFNNIILWLYVYAHSSWKKRQKGENWADKTAKHDVKLAKPAQNQRKNRLNGKYNFLLPSLLIFFSGLIVHILFHLT